MRRLLTLCLVLLPALASAQVAPAWPSGVTPPIVGLAAFNASAPITPTSMGVPASTCAAPGIYLTTATTTGMAFTATPSVIICVNGTAVVTTSSTAVTSTVPGLWPNGTAGAPSQSFSGAPTFGAFFSSSFGYAISASGAAQIGWDSTGTTLINALQFTSALGTIGDVSLSRGAANRLDLASGDSFRLNSGDITFATAGNIGDGAGNSPSIIYAETSISSAGNLQFNGAGGGFFIGSNAAIINTAPTVTSAGTSPSVVANGTAAFRVNVGTGGTATTIVMAMPAATTGWNCFAENITATAANRADQRVAMQSSTTTAVTVQNQTISTGAALAFTASDIVSFICTAY